MTEKMTEAQAWRELAEWCVTHNGLLCVVTEEWGNSHAWVTYGPAPFGAPWARMHKRAKGHSQDSDVEVQFPYCRTALAPPHRNSHARVIFCLLMAHECEEEGQ
jgi:hypothetical protein